MVTDEQMRHYWGNSLMRLTDPLPQDVKLTEKTIGFLRAVGVPPAFAIDWPWAITFHSSSDFERLSCATGSYMVIGKGHGEVQIGVKASSGAIVALDPPNYEHATFINSDMRSLVIFLYLLSQLRSDTDDVSYKAEYLQIKERLIQEDSAALDDEESWWSTLLEEIEGSL